MNPGVTENQVILSRLTQTAYRVQSVRERNWALRAELRSLRECVACAESEVRLGGQEALAMPEDLGDWSEHGPRIEGLVARILQVQEQSVGLAKAASREDG